MPVCCGMSGCVLLAAEKVEDIVSEYGTLSTGEPSMPKPSGVPRKLLLSLGDALVGRCAVGANIFGGGSVISLLEKGDGMVDELSAVVTSSVKMLPLGVPGLRRETSLPVDCR